MTKGEIKYATMFIDAAEMNYNLAAAGAVQAFIGAALTYAKGNGVPFLTRFFGSPITLGINLILTLTDLAFSTFAAREGMTGAAVIYKLTCVEQVKHQAGQEFTYLDWQLTDVSVRWYKEINGVKMVQS